MNIKWLLLSRTTKWVSIRRDIKLSGSSTQERSVSFCFMPGSVSFVARWLYHVRVWKTKTRTNRSENKIENMILGKQRLKIANLIWPRCSNNFYTRITKKSCNAWAVRKRRCQRDRDDRLNFGEGGRLTSKRRCERKALWIGPRDYWTRYSKYVGFKYRIENALCSFPVFYKQKKKREDEMGQKKIRLFFFFSYTHYSSEARHSWSLANKGKLHPCLPCNDHLKQAVG